MSYKLHGAFLSPFVRKARAYCYEKDIAFEAVNVDPARFPADYHLLNPLMRIPALEHGDLRLADSAVICQYLEKRHPEPALYPTDPALFAQALWLEKYADYELAPLCTYGFFRQRLILPIRGLSGDDALVEAARQQVPALFDYLESVLGERHWLVGDQLSIADIAVASQLVNYHHGGETLDADRWPALHAHMTRMLARPSFAGPLEEERALIGKIKAKLGIA